MQLLRSSALPDVGSEGAVISPLGPACKKNGGVDEFDEFDQHVSEALDSLPDDLRAYMSNVAVVVEDEPPRGMPLLGLYEGYPLTRRSSGYAGVPPDKITIYRGPLERISGGDPERLRSEIRHVVVHEIAHHFGISDERLRELDRY
jgi:predicted Zn-dependent protease with MMP-like domain